MNNRYRVFGRTEVVVVIEVDAESEAEAYEIAYDEVPSLQTYSGNGGVDKLIGVDGENDSVSVDNEIIYDDIECLGAVEEIEEEEEEWY